MGSLTQQVVVVPITFRPPQDERTCELGALLCKVYMDTSTLFSLSFLSQHYWWVSYPSYPYFVVSFFY
jgi:hypothetical protein